MLIHLMKVGALTSIAMTRSLHNGMIIHPSAVQLTGTSRLVTVVGKVSNETPFFYI